MMFYVLPNIIHARQYNYRLTPMHGYTHAELLTWKNRKITQCTKFKIDVCKSVFYLRIDQAAQLARPSKNFSNKDTFVRLGEAHSPSGHLDALNLELQLYTAADAKRLRYELNVIHSAYCARIHMPTKIHFPNTHIFSYRLNILFEGQQIIEATTNGPPSIVHGVGQHPKCVDITFFAAGF